MKDARKINIGGGGMLWLNTDLNETALPDDLMPPDSWLIAGFLDSLTLVDTSETGDIRDENGDVIATTERQDDLRVNLKLLQTGKDEIDFFRNNRFMQGYYPVLTEAEFQQWRFPAMRVILKNQIEFSPNLRMLEFDCWLEGFGDLPAYYIVAQNIGFTHWGQTDLNFSQLNDPFYQLT